MNSIGERVLITGGAGFVGACAVRELVRRGHAVSVLLRDPDKAWRLSDVLDACRVHEGDLRDRSAVRSCLHAARPDVVLHLATYGAYEQQADADAILDTNIFGTQHLLAAAAEAKTSLFVQTGSSSEYGFKSQTMHESDRLEPNSVYAVAKAAQTHLGQLHSRRGTMPVVSLRLFSVFGPLEEPTRLIPSLLRNARAQAPLHLAAPETARDFVFIDDVLDALLDFAKLRDAGGEVINIGSGRETKLREVVAEVQRLFPGRSEVRWGAFPARHWDTAHWSGDVSKAQRLLGWTPRHTLAQGLAKMAEWMRITGDDHGSSVLRAAG
jgi:nucleoside-diphosphate-sugar epimerase